MTSIYLTDSEPIPGPGDIRKGKLIGGTDAQDYFYFICPQCPDGRILQLPNYEIQLDEDVQYDPESRIKPKRDFVIAYALRCPECEFHAIVKLGNIGWTNARMEDVMDMFHCVDSKICKAIEAVNKVADAPVRIDAEEM